MNSNLIELLQTTLGCPPLQKVDPNTQEAATTDVFSAGPSIMQVIIPALLAGFYKLTRTPEGAALVLRGNFSTEWLEILFGGNEEAVINNIAEYMGSDDAMVRAEMIKAAPVAADLIKYKANALAAATEENIMTTMKNERNIIFHYLPPALQIGELLNDGTMDDQTHKMDGPVSGMMHSIENAFSGNPPPAEPQK